MLSNEAHSLPSFQDENAHEMGLWLSVLGGEVLFVSDAGAGEGWLDLVVMPATGRWHRWVGSMYIPAGTLRCLPRHTDDLTRWRKSEHRTSVD